MKARKRTSSTSAFWKMSSASLSRFVSGSRRPFSRPTTLIIADGGATPHVSHSSEITAEGSESAEIRANLAGGCSTHTVGKSETSVTQIRRRMCKRELAQGYGIS